MTRRKIEQIMNQNIFLLLNSLELNELPQKFHCKDIKGKFSREDLFAKISSINYLYKAFLFIADKINGVSLKQVNIIKVILSEFNRQKLRIYPVSVECISNYAGDKKITLGWYGYNNQSLRVTIHFDGTMTWCYDNMINSNYSNSYPNYNYNCIDLHDSQKMLYDFLKCLDRFIKIENRFPAFALCSVSRNANIPNI